MSSQQLRSRPDRHTEDSPTVQSVIEGMQEERAEIVSDLRDFTLALEGAEERTLYDSFCREWTPAYYARGKQLFHVHNFRAGIRATMFVGSRTLEPFILESGGLSSEMRLIVANTVVPRGTGMFRVPLTSREDVARFMELVRIKWAIAWGDPRRTQRPV